MMTVHHPLSVLSIALVFVGCASVTNTYVLKDPAQVGLVTRGLLDTGGNLRIVVDPAPHTEPVVAELCDESKGHTVSMETRLLKDDKDHKLLVVVCERERKLEMPMAWTNRRISLYDMDSVLPSGTPAGQYLVGDMEYSPCTGWDGVTKVENGTRKEFLCLQEIGILTDKTNVATTIQTTTQQWIGFGLSTVGVLGALVTGIGWASGGDYFMPYFWGSLGIWGLGLWQSFDPLTDEVVLEGYQP